MSSFCLNEVLIQKKCLLLKILHLNNLTTLVNQLQVPAQLQKMISKASTFSHWSSQEHFQQHSRRWMQDREMTASGNFILCLNCLHHRVAADTHIMGLLHSTTIDFKNVFWYSPNTKYFFKDYTPKLTYRTLTNLPYHKNTKTERIIDSFVSEAIVSLKRIYKNLSRLNLD